MEGGKKSFCGKQVKAAAIEELFVVWTDCM